MNILFRADSSSTIGTGHIMRDLVLAKKYPNDNIIFVTQNLEGNINYKIEEEGYKLEILKSNSIDELNTLIKKYDIDMLIIDHYGIDYNYEKELKAKNLKLKIMALDDTYEKHYCDILLNHNIYAKAEKYKDLVPKWCEIRCGEKFTLLRDEFLKEKEVKREKIYDIFISYGGADTANLNISTLRVLEEVDKSLKIVVVTTKANSNLDKLKEYVRNKNNIELKINTNKIAKLLNQSKLAIITPSVTVNEVYFLNIPFIAIQTADNQKYMTSFLVEKGFLILENFNKKVLKRLICKI
jgi:UDP-2,4-diacetamido-2,4,6-trideoxy-beta-L-altropyranose hydrolase